MRRSDLLLDRGIGRKALDCITMSAPLNASSLWLLGSGGGAGVRFVRGTARYRTWRAVKRRPLDRASRSLVRGSSKN